MAYSLQDARGLLESIRKMANDEEAVNLIMTALSDEWQEGYDEGQLEGYNEGYADGGQYVEE